MKKKFKKRYIVIAIIVLIVAGSLLSGNKGNATKPVETIKVSRSDIESLVSSAGTVRASSTKEVYAVTSVKVSKLYIDKNDTVVKGQKIMDLDLDDLNSNLEQLKIEKEIKELNYAKSFVSNEKGMLSLIQTENLADTAKQNYENNLELYNMGAISKLELDNSQKQYEEAEANLALSKVGNDTDSDILKKQIDLTQMQIRDLEKQISKMQELMVASESGVVSELNIVEGGYLNTAAPAYKVVDTDKFEIVANVKEFTAKNIEIGQKVYITGDAFTGITYTGHVKSISPIATSTTTSVGTQTFIEVIIAVDEEATKLADGLSVTCDVVANEKDNILYIPLSAFMEDSDSNKYVYTIENNTLKKIIIKTGINSEDKLEIIEGLVEGQEIVDKIGNSYQEGMNVTVFNKV